MSGDMKTGTGNGRNHRPEEPLLFTRTAQRENKPFEYGFYDVG
jgi:hypothetical protein